MKTTHVVLIAVGMALLVSPMALRGEGMAKSNVDTAKTGGVAPAVETYESLLVAMIDTIEEMTDLLATVTDKASAEAIVPELKALVVQMNDLEAAMGEIDETDEEINTLLDEKYAERMDAALEAFMDELMRVALDDDVADTLEAVFAEF